MIDWSIVYGAIYLATVAPARELKSDYEAFDWLGKNAIVPFIELSQ